MPDRHKNRPKAVRMPDGLEAWYAERASVTGQPVNALIVGALEDYRQRHSGATAAPRGTTAVREAPQREMACPHPKARIHKGLCGACGTNVGPASKGSRS